MSTVVLLGMRKHLDAKFKDSKEPLDFLSSQYKQDNFFDNHKLTVKPESVVFGTNFCSHGGNSRLVCESFQYVSVQKNIK